MNVRHPAVAGLFYPDQPHVLTDMVQAFVQAGASVPLQTEKPLRILVAPHAGYIYSGPVAGVAYKQLDALDKTKHWKVFLLGPTHRVPLYGATVLAFDHFETPLGLVPVSPLAKTLAQQVGFLPQVDHQEHSLEVHLPFLQLTLPSFEIIPILLGMVQPQGVAHFLEPHLDDHSLIVVSTDLSHYLPYEQARQTDQICNEAIPQLDIARMEADGDACGKIGVVAAMELAKKYNWHGQFLDYKNSGDTSGSKAQVVGYGAYSFAG